MEKLLEKGAGLRMAEAASARPVGLGATATSGEISAGGQPVEVPQDVKNEVEQTRYGERVIAALQIRGDVSNPRKLMSNMGYEFPQKGRKFNIEAAVDKLEDLSLVEVKTSKSSSRKKGAIKLTALGEAYEVSSEIIKALRTNSDDQSSGK